MITSYWAIFLSFRWTKWSFEWTKAHEIQKKFRGRGGCVNSILIKSCLILWGSQKSLYVNPFSLSLWKQHGCAFPQTAGNWVRFFLIYLKRNVQIYLMNELWVGNSMCHTEFLPELSTRVSDGPHFRISGRWFPENLLKGSPWSEINRTRIFLCLFWSVTSRPTAPVAAF